MKLTEFAKRFQSRQLAAKSLNVSYNHFCNLLAADTEVMQTYDGRWMTLTKYNKFFDDVDENDEFSATMEKLAAKRAKL